MHKHSYIFDRNMKFKDVDLNYYYGEVIQITDSKEKNQTDLWSDYENYTLDDHLFTSVQNPLDK